MATIKETNTATINNSILNTTTNAAPTEKSTLSAGINDQTGQVPSPAEKEGYGCAMSSCLFQSPRAAIDEVVPKGTSIDIDVLMQEMARELEQTQGILQKVGIEEATSRRKAGLEDLQDKQAQAEKARKKAASKSGIAKIFSKVASYLGIAASLISGALLLATGNPAGALVLGMGLMMLGNEISQEQSGKSMFKNMGMSSNAEMGLMIGLSVATLVLTCGAASLGSAGSAISATARSTATATSLIFDASSAIVNVASAGVNLDATKARAATLKIESDIKEFEAIMASLREYIERSLDQLTNIETFASNLTQRAVDSLNNKQTLIKSIKLTA